MDISMFLIVEIVFHTLLRSTYVGASRLEPEYRRARPVFSLDVQIASLEPLDAKTVPGFSDVLRTILVKINYLSLLPTT
jgi:hypothetical protein